jgi:antitoxin component of RelBE/YafQ-DinJ toxin-antitoxin module
MKKKNKKSPSRTKYEINKPTISARVTLETKQKLKAVLAKSGLSTADLFKSIADELELKTIPIEEARQKGFEQGYKKAHKLFAVTFPCDVCGKPVEVTNLKLKQVISEYIAELNWGHAKCHEQRENKSR